MEAVKNAENKESVLQKGKNTLKTAIKGGDLGYYPLIALVWCQTILVQYLRAAIGGFFGGYTPADIIIGALYVLSAMFLVRSISEDIRMTDVLAVIGIAASYGLSCWFYLSENQYLGDCTYTFLCECLPLIFVGMIIDFDRVKKFLYWLSVATIVAFFVYTIIMGEGKEISEYDWQEDMDSAYKLLPHILLVTLFMFEKPNLFNIVISILSTVLLVSLGTRGPVLFLIAYLGVYIVVFKNTKSSVRVKAVLLAIVVFIIYNFRSFISFLQTLFRRFGMSNRIIARLLENDLTYSSGRDELYSKTFAAIEENPIMGYGYAGDRPILDGIYSHNIAIEFWVSFGIIVGTIALGFVVYFVLRGLFSCKNSYERGFMFLLIVCGFAKLFLSGSFLNERFFFLLLGYSIRCIRKKKAMLADNLIENSEKQSVYIKPKFKLK